MIIRPKRRECSTKGCSTRVRAPRYATNPKCALHKPKPPEGGRGARWGVTPKRELRRAAADYWLERNPGKRFTGRQWIRMRRQMRREEAK